MSAISKPTVSVCIPVYNCEKYLGAAIESVLSQTFKDFELVIVNDCSTDHSQKVINRYNDPRICVIENKTNIGLEGNWNKALSQARGKYIKILCQDDLLYPSCLERQIAILEDPSNKNIALVSSGRNIINENGKKILMKNFKGRDGRFPGLYAIKKTIRSGGNLLGEPPAVLFRTEALDTAGLFDGKNPYVIDLELWCRILLNTDVYLIPDALCAFRVSTNSLSVNLNSQNVDFRSLISKLGSDPRYRLSFLDRLIGTIMASVNGLLRQIFYAIILRRKE